MITLGKATRQLVVFPKADNELEESEHRETHEMTSIILLGVWQRKSRADGKGQN